MTITGGIKFFERASSLFKDGTTAVASSNSDAANNILTNRQLVYWESIGSDDTTTETITITYNKSVTIDRIFLNRINFKEFTVKYDVAAVWTDFTGVTGYDNVSYPSGITETTFSEETAYYEVDSISTTGIQITATKTQTADQEKIIYNLFTTVELGTLQPFAQVSPLDFSRKSRQSESLSGLANIQKGYETMAFALTLQNHGNQADHDLFTTLYNRDKSFLVWPSGGRSGVSYFSYNLKGFTLRDIFNMQTSGGISPSWPGSIYLTAPNNAIAFVQSI